MEVHPASKETFDAVADWVSPMFFFSKNMKWLRMGVVGILADYALFFNPGDILEIGCGESSIYLTALSVKYGRDISYCDIEGCKIINPRTVPGYMSDKGHFYNCPSDKMFADNKLGPLAFTFIDGDHTYEQVKRDFWNAEKLTVENGFILLHDSYPPTEGHIDFNACGDVYKFRQEIEKDKRFDCLTFPNNQGGSVGFTLIRKKPANLPYYQE